MITEKGIEIRDDVAIKLRELNGRYPRFFAALGQRTYSDWEMPLDGPLSDVRFGGMSKRELISLMRDLEELGLGKLIVGRRQKKTRFQWAVSTVEIARVASDEAEASDATQLESGGQTINHQFQLRPNLRIEFALPADLSKSEAERLAEFMRTLPFE